MSDLHSSSEGMSGSEVFAELFALSHFGIKSLGGVDFSDKFEKLMQ